MLDNIEKLSYMLGSELWESKFDGLLKGMYCRRVGNRKYKLYDSGSGPGQQIYSQSSPWDLAVFEGQRNGKFIQKGKLGHPK